MYEIYVEISLEEMRRALGLSTYKSFPHTSHTYIAEKK